MDTCVDPYFTVKTTDKISIVVKNMSDKETNELLNTYRIPNDRSPDLMSVDVQNIDTSEGDTSSDYGFQESSSSSSSDESDSSHD